MDLANWMVGSRARRVASFGGLNFFKPEKAHHMERLGPDAEGHDAYSGWAGLIKRNPFTSDKDIVDNQVAIIEYANGVRATFHTNCNAGICERRRYVLGSEGALRADNVAGTILTQRIRYDTKSVDHSSDTRGDHGGGDEVLSRELSESLLNGAKPGAGIEEGSASAIVTFAIDDAMDRGVVIDMEPFWRKAGLPCQ